MFITYVLWSLLPISLILLTLWAVFKKWFGVAGREYAGEYASSAFFALIIYALAVFLSKRYYEDLADLTGISDWDPGCLHFLIYPALLLLFAKIHTVITEKSKPANSANIGARVLH
jgi:hypothetical protein